MPPELPAVRILIVDDDKAINDYMQTLLERDGFHVKTLNDPTFVEEEVRTGGYHLVILDLMMPVLNGQDVLRVLCNSRPDLPVLVLSAVALSEANVELVPKPVSVERLDQLLEKVEERVKERRARRDARSSAVS